MLVTAEQYSGCVVPLNHTLNSGQSGKFYIVYIPSQQEIILSEIHKKKLFAIYSLISENCCQSKKNISIFLTS